MNTKIISPNQFITMPWKNGLGKTTELMVQPADERDTNQGFLWRLSIASVIENGGFSDFNGYQRILTLLDGKDITLCYDGLSEDKLRNPLQKACFSGDVSTSATLHQGPIKDFNVIARRDACSAKVNNFTHAHEQTLELNADKCFVYAHKASIAIQFDGMKRIELSAGHLLMVDNTKASKLIISAEAAIVVQITYKY
ncbi:MAG TPA: hypothetical protein DE179_12080 [Oceanospirillaceae bacterium]|nr:hypothetical protein [Oceanospirillaceae bacterium]